MGVNRIPDQYRKPLAGSKLEKDIAGDRVPRIAMENVAHFLVVLLMGTITLGIAVWMAGAIYFDVGRGARWSWVPTVGWCLFAVVLFATWRPLWCPYGVLLATTLVFVGWWLSLKPSHDREWDASVAVLPRAVRGGDVVTIENVRNN